MYKVLSVLFLFICFFGNAQQTHLVDFLSVKAEVIPNAIEESIKGTVSYQFKILQKTDSVYLDAIYMKVFDVVSKQIDVSSSEKKVWLTGNFRKDKIYDVTFSYTATPKQTLYFTGNQIWTQGQGKYTSHWLPSIDDMNDKLEFDLTIATSKNKAVIANGKFLKKNQKDSLAYWHFDMKQPMASYLAAFAIGDFDKKSINSQSGIPIELYYKPEDANKVEPTYRYTKQIFDFLVTEIGVPYPWQNYKQVPVRDFLYAGMENTTATIFSEAFVVDSIGFADRNYVNVNAHELAHQWFGDLVTETNGTHHWLQEGFATYFAQLAEREVFGNDYYYWKLYNAAEQLKELSDSGKGERLLNPQASSLTFYEKGAWALTILREKIGDQAFKTALKNYLNTYQFKNVSTDDFLSEVKKVTDVDISSWEADWLRQSAFKAEQALNYLSQSSFMKSYFEISALRNTAFVEKKDQLSFALTSPNDFVGQEAVYQLFDEPILQTLPLYKKAFKSENLYVRQAIANTLTTIPNELQEEYESLLNDASYVTKEAALYNLWINFPEKRNEYLDKMKGVVGFQNKNVRQLWLVLALVTEGYEADKKQLFASELINYSSKEFSFEIREKAFEFINELNMYTSEALKNLVNASMHHNWRFKKYARKLLDEVLKNSVYKKQLEGVLFQLPKKEKDFLQAKLSE
ncbi:M1 family metallopeptidase [Marixanthomonas sp. SCSIO 43207]|uniref:M1 family metallopeptidase n=1 Tax=Marixanthomonas sp. SCSIO 43207 TaxID=2779360 RepID=UPI001CA8F8A1|nr:M1 family metallopeptidase [Marixanthomonas sp. SCSIO 43207]UAB81036.1 M1 family metallopeptidase [Marixanthomonas sp. SCSIO 43207]